LKTSLARALTGKKQKTKQKQKQNKKQQQKNTATQIKTLWQQFYEFLFHFPSFKRPKFRL